MLNAGNAAAKRSAGDLTVAAVTLATGAITKLFDGGTFARYVPTGHIAFVRDDALLAAPFDAASLTVGETRTPLVQDLWMDPVWDRSSLEAPNSLETQQPERRRLLP